MKNNIVYLLSGIPGSGKDTFLRENELMPFSISADELRKLLVSPTLGDNGEFVNNNEMNDYVFRKYIELIENRVRDSGFLIINDTNIIARNIKTIEDIVKKYNGEICLVDFELKPLSYYIEINEKRSSYDFVPESKITEIYNIKKNNDLSGKFRVISKNEFLKEIKKTPEELCVNADQYKNIHFIGDVQGCAKSMLEFIQGKTNNSTDLYVFLGDYIDRGKENAIVLSFIEKMKDRNNFIFLRGNHDENIIKYVLANDNDYSGMSKIFVEQTLPEIIKKGFDKERLKNIYSSFEDYLLLKYGDKILFANHAGIGNLPKYPLLMSKSLTMYGNGAFNMDVDKSFADKEAALNIVQIHGHRNEHNKPIINSNSINLEGGVEYGEHLRIATVSKNKNKVVFTPHYIENKNYIRGMLKMNEEELVFNKEAMLEYQIGYNELTVKELVDKLRKHPMIQESVDEINPHISSFNFSRMAFYDSKNGHFDDELVSHARGLFINTSTNNIIARGFEKFFNLNEKEETKIENLGKTYNFPITLYEKENGFFGLIGYDEESDELIFTSKSRATGDFVNYFKNIAEKTLSFSELNKMKRYAQKYNVNYIFEVIDMENDPHIVNYTESKIVLLDIVKRGLRFQNTTYESLVDFAGSFKDLECKKRVLRFQNENLLVNFIKSMKKTNKFKHEGFVVEDCDGKRFKLKTPYYDAWKLLRTECDGYLRRERKMKSQIEKTTRKSVKNGLIEEMEKLPLRYDKRIKSKLSNIGIQDEELHNNIIRYFSDFILKNKSHDFSNKDFYSVKKKYEDTEKNNKKEVSKRKLKI